MRWRAIVCAVVLSAIAAAPAAAATPPKRGLLVPGRSLGGLRLGMTEAQVRGAWGSNFGVCRGCPNLTWYFNYRRYRPQGAGVSFRNGRVEAIFTLWAPPGWRTPSGLKIGDPASRISQLYGPLSRTPCGQYSALILPMAGGVNVFYVSNRKLWGFGLLNFLVDPCR
jgi:hypothetical protein